MATAHKLPSGNYRVLAYVGMKNGKRQYKSFTASDKRTAEYKATLFLLKKKASVRNGLTVGEAINRYILSKNAVLSPKTVKEYSHLRKNAMQSLMDIYLKDLTNETAQIAVNEYSKGHSPKTIRNAVGLLSAALKMHHPDFRLNVSLPQRNKTEITIPDDTAIKQLLDHTSGTVMYTVILLATTLGMRRSEICALEWSDINTKAALIHINKAMVINTDRQWVSKTTKTTSSTRTLSVPPFLISYLMGLDRSDKRIVDIINPDAITYRFIKLRDKCGLSLRFHDLRHYYASLLLALGVPDKYAMARMGHSTTNMLKTVYQHLTDDKQREVDLAVNDKMDALFKQA